MRYRKSLCKSIKIVGFLHLLIFHCLYSLTERKMDELVPGSCSSNFPKLLTKYPKHTCWVCLGYFHLQRSKKKISGFCYLFCFICSLVRPRSLLLPFTFPWSLALIVWLPSKKDFVLKRGFRRDPSISMNGSQTSATNSCVGLYVFH